MNKPNIRDLTPAQLAAAEPDFWATDATGGQSICNAVRVKGAEGPFSYLTGQGGKRRVISIGDEGCEAGAACDAHHLAVLALVRSLVSWLDGVKIHAIDKTVESLHFA